MNVDMNRLIQDLVLLLGILVWLEARFRPLAVKVLAREEQQTSLLVAVAAKEGIKGLSNEEAEKLAAGEIPDAGPLLQKIIAGAVTAPGALPIK